MELAYTGDGKNAMLNHLGGLIDYVSLHDGNGDELSGGDPAYARQAINWNAASGGEMTASNEPVFNVPEDTTVAQVGFWTLAAGGVEHARTNVVNETYAQQGLYTVLSAKLDLNK